MGHKCTFSLTYKSSVRTILIECRNFGEQVTFVGVGLFASRHFYFTKKTEACQ